MIVRLRVAISNRRLLRPVRWFSLGAMVVVCIGLIRGLDPVFVGNGYVPGLLGAAVAAVLVAVVCWKLRVPFAGALVVGFVGFTTYLAYALFPSSLTFGLPLWTSLQNAWTASTSGWSDLLSTPAPTAPSLALLGAPAFIIWWFGFLSASALLRSPFGALSVAPLPPVWFALLLLGPGPSPGLLNSMLVIAGAALAVALHAAADDSELHAETEANPGAEQHLVVGQPPGASAGSRIRATAQRAPAVVGLIATSLGLLLTGSTLLSEVDRRDPRTLWQSNVEIDVGVSPLSLVRSQRAAGAAGDENAVVSLTDLGDFDRPVLYLRTATLDSFDGALWSAHGDYALAGPLLTEVDTSNRDLITISVRMDAELDRGRDRRAPYLPTPGDPLRIDGLPVVFNRTASTIVQAPSQPLPQSATYEVTAIVPFPIDDPRVDGAARFAGRTERRLLSDPTALFDREDATAEETAILETLLAFEAEAGLSALDEPVGILRALRDAMTATSFGQNLSSAHGHSLAAVARYLGNGDTSRIGFSEQASSAFVLLARRQRIDARVAVGYRIDLAAQSDTDENAIAVRAGDAHAWVEARLDGIGWVTIDPSVDRSVVQTPPPPQLAVPNSSVDEAASFELPQFKPPPAEESEPSGSRWLIWLAVGFFALVAPLALKQVRRARRRRQRDSGRAIRSAWAEVVDALADRGLQATAPSTEIDIAYSALEHGLVELDAEMHELARLVGHSRWSLNSGTPDGATRAWELSDKIRAHLADQSSKRDSLRAGLAPWTFLGRFAQRRGRLQPMLAPPALDISNVKQEEIVELRDESNFATAAS